MVTTLSELMFLAGVLIYAYASRDRFRYGRYGGNPMPRRFSRLLALDMAVAAVMGTLLHMWMRFQTTPGGTSYTSIVSAGEIIIAGIGAVFATHAIQVSILETPTLPSELRHKAILPTALQLFLGIIMVAFITIVCISQIKRHG
jgi:hypothetical protein